jgi:hypothetical protein
MATETPLGKDNALRKILDLVVDGRGVLKYLRFLKPLPLCPRTQSKIQQRVVQGADSPFLRKAREGLQTQRGGVDRVDKHARFDTRIAPASSMG